jgi:hypothetical protein
VVLLFILFVIVALSARANEVSEPWSMFDRRLCVSGAFLFFWWRFGNADFDELRTGLSSSYVTALLFVVGADHYVRCSVVARALCLLL